MIRKINIYLSIFLVFIFFQHVVPSRHHNTDMIVHHSEELNDKENKIFTNTENLNFHLSKNLQRKVKHYLNEYLNKFDVSNVKHTIENKIFFQKLNEYLSKLFYIDMLLYNRINYENKNKILEKIFKEHACQSKLKSIDNENWRCIANAKKEEDDEINFCACSYEYECDYNEQLSLGIPKINLTDEIINELQPLCQISLNEETSQQWTCKIEKINSDFKDDDDNKEINSESLTQEAVCECFTIGKCAMQKVLEE
jgi:hypothetical protein